MSRSKVAIQDCEWGELASDHEVDFDDSLLTQDPNDFYDPSYIKESQISNQITHSNGNISVESKPESQFVPKMIKYMNY